MSCEVANSPFSEPGFPDPFDNIGNDRGGTNDVDLSTISDFNSGLNGINQDCIDPQNLSHANSPTSQYDPTLTPEYTPSAYPTEFENISQAPSPYFQLIEAPFGAPFIPAATQNFHHLHRRSVSEPPDGALMHHPMPHPTAPVFFHRDGHKLGVPRNPESAWPNKKVKNSRAKPYQQRNSPRKPAPQPIQSRYMLRRPGGQMQTQQPTQLPPTSVPHDMPGRQPQQHHNMHHAPPPDHHHQMRIHMPQSPEPQYVSSRLCTPAPEAVDPFLSAAPPGPMVAPMMGANHVAGLPLTHNQGASFHSPASANGSVTMLKMGVGELRALIADVVREAVGGLQAQQAISKAKRGDVAITDCSEQPVVVVDDDAGNGGDEEEIVVAGSFGGAGEEATGAVREGQGDVRKVEMSEA